MPQRTAVIGAEHGLHARPAALFVEAVTATGLPITIAKSDGGAPVDARSVIAVMTLGVGRGEQVTLACPDPDAEPTLEKLADMLASDLDAA
ncbi:phosphotransferase system HPr (HPr) family protein [Nocardiopsis mwathae]|uniref:Phosphocarrier protein HPr n=1 Tax=Nocardiopsis mwathae TaxID=1472723 RepID=A0A7X0D6V7_9ACTN|nr:HPr family phosphocarrier protein [Nocardiopsis mwathae]MBB6173106.1 phosphotransferase system HPr (HPr) family protein [Nocardiopsis mwathae]